MEEKISNKDDIFEDSDVASKFKFSSSNNSNCQNSVPKLMMLATSSLKATSFTEPILPNVQSKLTHDHNAFLCSLFNKIDLGKGKEMPGPFSTTPAPVSSIIAEAVEQHRPVGEEELPQYKDTISNMVINASKKIFNSDYETIDNITKEKSPHTDNLVSIYIL